MDGALPGRVDRTLRRARAAAQRSATVLRRSADLAGDHADRLRREGREDEAVGEDEEAAKARSAADRTDRLADTEAPPGPDPTGPPG